jgi:hypothetical protein
MSSFDDPPPTMFVNADDDMPPSGEEARAEREETLMPLIWIGLGAAAVAGFLVLAVVYSGVGRAPHATATLPSAPLVSGA